MNPFLPIPRITVQKRVIPSPALVQWLTESQRSSHWGCPQEWKGPRRVTSQPCPSISGSQLPEAPGSEGDNTQTAPQESHHAPGHREHLTSDTKPEARPQE